MEFAAVTALPNDSRMGLTAEINETKLGTPGEVVIVDDDDDDDNDEANCLRIIFAASVLPEPDCPVITAATVPLSFPIIIFRACSATENG